MQNGIRYLAKMDNPLDWLINITKFLFVFKNEYVDHLLLPSRKNLFACRD